MVVKGGPVKGLEIALLVLACLLARVWIVFWIGLVWFQGGGGGCWGAWVLVEMCELLQARERERTCWDGVG